MRLPYAPSSPPPDAAPGTDEIYARIAARRAPRPLIPLDLALLHSPPVADGWNSLLGAIRSKTTLSQDLLELAVCRVAVLNGAVYEWNAHAPLALKAGVKPEVLRVVRELPVGFSTSDQGAGCLSDVQAAVLAYTDQMTKNVNVDEEVFNRLKSVAGLNDREVVELTAAVAAYNCVSRFLVALDVGENNGNEMRGVEELVREVEGKS
ncbi:putative 4-carboxymuconolactone decarboxylase [Thermoascus aurantiacus ATCC 26904]